MAFDHDEFLERTCGFDSEEWLRAQEWLLQRLRQVAHNEDKCYYGDLTDEMRRKGIIDLNPHEVPFATLLGQINVREHDANHPLITAVVLSRESGQPGVGFWNIARSLGIDVGETEAAREKFWIDSLNASYAEWRDDSRRS